MTVVVGYVPDPTGLLAVRQATREALWRGTDVVVVNVVGATGYAAPTAAEEQTLDAIAAELGEAGVRFEIRHVDDTTSARPAEILLGIAEDTEADLIVVGLKRTSAVAKAVLGSTVQRVLQGARCPVLSVRAFED